MNRKVLLSFCSEVAEYEGDVGTARCRLPSQLQQDLRAAMQSIVEVRVWSKSDICGARGVNEERHLDILCVAYPDTHHVLGDDEISIDDTVVLSTTTDPIASPASHCEILCVHPPVTCSVVHVTPENITSCSLFGLPVGENCTILPKVSYRTEKVKTSKISMVSQWKAQHSRKFGLVGMSTVLVGKSQIEMKKENLVHSDEKINDSCLTSAAREIIKKVVNPVIKLPKCAQISGLLLLGPPGVGKTSAIRAVQKVCSKWCSVEVVEVSIPDVLADEEPEQYLLSMLEKSKDPIKSMVRSPIEQGGRRLSEATPPPPSPPITYSSPDKTVSIERSTPSFSFLSPPPSVSGGSGHLDEVGMTPRDDGTESPSSQLRVLFFDEIDALGKTDNQSEVQRVVTQVLCDWFDRKYERDFQSAPSCCIIATSNRSEDVAPALRRGGRLDLEVNIASSSADRYVIARHLLQSLKCDGNCEYDNHIDELARDLAERTGGYVAADIVALVSKAMEMRESLSPSSGFADKQSWDLCFDAAMSSVPPSCLRGVAIRTPSLGYDDVVGNLETKRSLQRVLRFFSPEIRPKMATFHLSMPGGVLLHGPPGNSKTRLVMAAASHHRLPVIFLSAADVYSPYVGDSEAEVRKAFSVSRQAAPCVLFLDELDAFVTNRDTGGSGSVEARVLATLLTEMDGIGYSEDAQGTSWGHSAGVAVMAATNRLGAIDAALLRKGRFHHVLHVPAPDESTRQQLMQYFSSKCLLTESETRRVHSKLREGMCGADVENLCREARLERIRLEVNKETSDRPH